MILADKGMQPLIKFSICSCHFEITVLCKRHSKLLTSIPQIKFSCIMNEPSALQCNKYAFYKRLTFQIDLIVAITFCQLSLAFSKWESSTAWKIKFLWTNMMVNAPVFFSQRARNYYCPMITYHSLPVLQVYYNSVCECCRSTVIKD